MTDDLSKQKQQSQKPAERDQPMTAESYLDTPLRPPSGDLGLPDNDAYPSQYPWQEDESYASLGDSMEDGSIFYSGDPLDESVEISTAEDIIAALREVFDPEIPVNIYDLGLIYSVDVEDNGNADIVMTLTTPNCPVAGTLPQMVADQAASCSGIGKAKVVLTWEPPWETSRMSEDAKMALGFID